LSALKKRLIALLTALTAAAALAAGSAFTYQGRLGDQGQPAQGTYDLRFTLCDAGTGGNQVGTITAKGVAVTNGLFTLTLDFGSAFNGSPLWLEVEVRTNSAGAFTRLTPRQALTATPYALYALNAGTVAAEGWPPGLLTNGQTDVNLAGTFTGNGAGLTNIVPPAHPHSLQFTNNIVVCDGDSRSVTSPGGYFGRLPGCLFFSNRVAAFYNVSISGAWVGQGIAHYTNAIQPHKPGPGQVGYLLEWYGINDLLSVDGPTAFRNKTSYWAMAKADGFKVITLTLPPANDGYSISVV
jgi:hypothetical protein